MFAVALLLYFVGFVFSQLHSSLCVLCTTSVAWKWSVKEAGATTPLKKALSLVCCGASPSHSNHLISESDAGIKARSGGTVPFLISPASAASHKRTARSILLSYPMPPRFADWLLLKILDELFQLRCHSPHAFLSRSSGFLSSQADVWQFT